jgi:hypothetical protein
MKTSTRSISPFIVLLATSVMLICFTNPSVAQEQDEENKEEVQTIAIHSRPLQRVGNTFESVWVIDNQTTHVPLRRTFEFDIIHRFGTINNGYEDFFGLYAPSNIRLGFGYTPTHNLMVGFGFTKERLLWDLNAKYAILKQSDEKMPINLTYYGNVAIDTRPSENFINSTDRLSYFHQLMVSRKISRDFSAQASINLSHMNAVEGYENEDGDVDGKMKNDHLSFTLLGRYKISDAFAFIANYDQPITQHPSNNPHPNISAGVELATPLHAFQVFMGNYQWIVPQYNNFYNQHDYAEGQFLIGFTITRLLDTQEENMGEMMFKRKNKDQ